MTERSTMLSEPWRFHFPYTRTAGPVVGRFLQGLRDGRILGLRMADGGVLVPPHAHDPRTSATLSEWVEVADAGSVRHWTWIEQPLPQHPLDRPFAYALIQLDGATTAMLHVVDPGSRELMADGMRVRARWAVERRGHILDIAAFEPETNTVPTPPSSVETDATPPEKHRFDAPFTTDYTILAGKALSEHLRGLQTRRFLGIRGPSGNVYFPPSGADPLTGDAVGDDVVELGQSGTVVRYCIVNIPVRGQQVPVPFVAADVLIDGADTTTMALVQGVATGSDAAGAGAPAIRLGLRVRAVWVDGEHLPPSMANVKWFEPADEPDRELEMLKDYL